MAEADRGQLPHLDANNMQRNNQQMQADLEPTDMAKMMDLDSYKRDPRLQHLFAIEAM